MASTDEILVTIDKAIIVASHLVSLIDEASAAGKTTVALPADLVEAMRALGETEREFDARLNEDKPE